MSHKLYESDLQITDVYKLSYGLPILAFEAELCLSRKIFGCWPHFADATFIRLSMIRNLA